MTRLIMIAVAAMAVVATPCVAQWSMSPTRVSEGAGRTDFTITRPTSAGTGVIIIHGASRGGTATLGVDFNRTSHDFVFLPNSLTSRGYPLTILEDNIYEGDEHFFWDVTLPDGTVQSFQITIEDNDPNPNPPNPAEPIADYLSARATALLEIQPGLTRFLNGPVGDVARSGIWFDANGASSEAGDAENRHVVGTLGAHSEVSNGLLLGGMIQYNAITAEITGETVGSIKGNGWMAGPYFAANDSSGQLRFEGKLLYGRSSSDVDFGSTGSGSFEGERWLAQAGVEGERTLGNGAVMIPSAGLGHAREIGEGFRDSLGRDVDGQTVSVTRLHLGTGFLIPVESARGELTLRPDQAFVLTDANGRYVEAEPEAGGRIGFGVDYRLENRVSLGFESFYSGFGRSGSELYGAGLKLRMEF